MGYQRLLEPGISGEAVKAHRDQGKKALGVVCCHIPQEILYAADVLPVRLRATGCADAAEAETWMSSFSCSYAKSILQYWLDGSYDLDGLIATDGCMMASRIYDNAAHINEKEGGDKFIRQFGAPRKCTPTTVQFFKEELQDLIAALEELSGNKITDEKLKEGIEKYNEARALVAQVYELRKEKNPVITGEQALAITMAASDLPVDDYIALLKEFLADAKNRAPVGDYRARLMIIGSALDDPSYLKIIEDKGGLFVCDALCFGERAFGEPFAADDADVLGSIAAHYLNRLVCPRMMDKHEELHDFIIDHVKEYDVDGVVYQRMQNCECWGGENVLMEKKLKDAGIPLITVEREENTVNAGQLAVRAEAFIEMIEKEA